MLRDVNIVGEHHLAPAVHVKEGVRRVLCRPAAFRRMHLEHAPAPKGMQTHGAQIQLQGEASGGLYQACLLCCMR